MVFMDIPIDKNTETITYSWDNDTPILNGVRCQLIEDPEEVYDIDQEVKGMLEKYW
jgi:hypothetical protein